MKNLTGAAGADHTDFLAGEVDVGRVGTRVVLFALEELAAGDCEEQTERR